MDFIYTARNKKGELQKDIMVALNEKAVVDNLRASGLVVTSIKLRSHKLDYKSIFEILRPVKLLDKITFIKNLAVMLKAGLPVSKALNILANQTENPKFSKILRQVTKDVEGGSSLADAVMQYPKVFSSIFVSMIRVGEVSGTLEPNLGYLGDQMQRDYDLVSKARGALTYPIIILIALGIVGFLMFTFVLPKLTSTFKDLKTPLPWMTRIVMSLVDICAHYGIFIAFGFIGLAVAFTLFRKSTLGKKIIHKIVLYLPLLSGIVIKINLARFVRVFASLIKSGMSIVEALDVSANVVGNVYYQKTINEASSKVKMGSALTSAFKKQPRLFPNLVVEMMEVGEESGTTDAVLLEVANFYESEVDQTMKNLSSILEPVIMMVIGGIVGFLAVALVTPIYNITQSIN